MNNKNIRSIWIRYDDELDCYNIEIERDSYVINYPRTNIVFSDNGFMAFPIRIVTLDEQMNTVNEFSLAPNDQETEKN